jgi:hypothetical protein
MSASSSPPSGTAPPRGIITTAYGRDAGSSVASAGSGLAGKRSFWVEAGDVVDILDIEDEVWWMVRLVKEDRAYQEIGETKPRQGWIPAPHVCLLSHRHSNKSHMVCGHPDWYGVSDEAPGPAARLISPEKSDTSAESCGTVHGEDREIAKLMTYKHIIAWRAATKRAETKMMPAEWIFDHLACHIGFFCILGAHCTLANASAPTTVQCLVGSALGFVAIDVLSTVYHLLLDYGVLATASTTVTDLHHKLPLNYNLFTQRQLLATSYIAVLPMHILHIAAYFLMYITGTTTPLYHVYMAASLAIGSTCGFVHNAAHRRRHTLPIFVGIRILQDIGLLLHPDIHAAHHRGKHDINYSLFSGITHPVTNIILRKLRDSHVIPLTDEHFRTKLD